MKYKTKSWEIEFGRNLSEKPGYRKPKKLYTIDMDLSVAFVILYVVVVAIAILI